MNKPSGARYALSTSTFEENHATIQELIGPRQLRTGPEARSLEHKRVAYSHPENFLVVKSGGSADLIDLLALALTAGNIDLGVVNSRPANFKMCVMPKMTGSRAVIICNLSSRKVFTALSVKKLDACVMPMLPDSDLIQEDTPLGRNHHGAIPSESKLLEKVSDLMQ